MCQNGKPASWLRRLRCALALLFSPSRLIPVRKPESSEPADQLRARLRLLAAVDLPEDRQALRSFVSELGWQITFLQDLQHLSPALAEPFSAAVILPATPARASALIAAAVGALPLPFRDLPIYFVAPAGSAEPDLARARLHYAAVGEKPLLLSAFRSAISRITGP